MKTCKKHGLVEPTNKWNKCPICHRERSKRYYWTHVELERDRSRKKFAYDPIKSKEKNRRWNAKNRAKRVQISLNYISRKKNAPINDLTLEEWERVIEYHHGECLYCGRSDRKLTRDHVIPLSKGGSNTMMNIVAACQSCNSRKKDKIVT